MYALITLIYFLFVSLVVFICHRSGLGRLGKIIITIALLLAPFWDMILAKGIMWNYAWKNIPLQKITRTVEMPESVLWIDEVWPGFDAYGRHWMVANYLDGVHLKTLILNEDDNRFYLYHATIEDFAASEKIRPEYEQMSRMISKLKSEAKAAAHKPGGNRELWQVIRQVHEPRLKKLGYEQTRKREIEQIFARGKVYESQSSLPPVKYRVAFRRHRLSAWQERFVWCDEIRIYDNIRHEDIAFSKRCLGYRPKIGLEPIGGTFSGGVRLGDEQAYEFDDKVLFGYAGVSSSYESKRSRLDK